MKKNGYLKKLLGVTLSAAMMAAALTGCVGGSDTGNADDGQASAAAESEDDGTENSGGESSDVVTLNILASKLSSNVTEYPDTHVIEAMAEQIGVKVNLIEADTDKYNVYMASGDGFDLILTPTTNFSQLIQGGVVRPLDDMMEEYGKDITANIPDTVAFSKDNWSDGTGSLYFLPCQIGVDAQGAAPGMGPLVRWDYYKEMGYPETNNIDEWLDMLAEMQKAHPETEDGLPVYGVSMFSDWGTWCYKFPLACYYGYNELSGAATGLYKPATMEYSNLLEKDGLFWASVDYYFKANQRGILDPDAFVTNFDDYTAKGSNGQFLTGPSAFAMGSFNSNHFDEAVGYEVIPTTWTNHWGGTNCTAGWIDKCFGISSKSAYPEKAMAFMNYIYSYDGCRVLYSGVEGVDYTMEDGVPVLTKESIDLYMEKGTAWKESGLGFDRNIVGLGNYMVHPEDGKTLDLFVDPSMYENVLTESQKDFSVYYGVKYPDEIFQQYREKYDVTDLSGTDAFTVALVPAATDDISRIEASLTEYALSQASKIILASDQAEYEELKAETMEEFDRIGLQKVIDWYSAEWEKAKEKAAAY